MYSILTVVIVVMTLIGFAWMLGTSIFLVWHAPSGGPPPEQGEAFTYVATGIAALVGGIATVGFGVKPGSSSSGQGVYSFLTSLGSVIAPSGSIKTQTILAGLYGGMYVVFGMLAIFTWISRPRATVTVVKNLATTFFGMALTIVTTFFSSKGTTLSS